MLKDDLDFVKNSEWLESECVFICELGRREELVPQVLVSFFIWRQVVILMGHSRDGRTAGLLPRMVVEVTRLTVTSSDHVNTDLWSSQVKV